jgi:hypothetical protein
MYFASCRVWVVSHILIKLIAYTFTLPKKYNKNNIIFKNIQIPNISKYC